MKYVILADSKNTEPFETPRQLSEINGEILIDRTIRLLKENGIEDILITSHDKRFDKYGKRYEPLHNDYDPIKRTGYWLNAFPIELLKEPICFLFGDVYYTDKAIKTIVEKETDGTLFFCTYKNTNPFYIKPHDEPLAYKVVDYELFKKHIDIVKDKKDKGLCCREPIVWELYRSINDIDVNTHIMTYNYISINDRSCDIDTIEDLEKLGGKNMVKVEVIEKFSLEAFDELKNVVRRNGGEKGKLNVGDTFECSESMADYLTGNNAYSKVVVKVLEVIPEEKEEVKTEVPSKKKKKKISKK